MERLVSVQSGKQNINCIISNPIGTARRVVLGVHGFGGSSRDDIQQGIAEEMALFGAATVRFDFPGHGESPMDSTFFTLENCMDALLAAAQYAAEEFSEAGELCVFATGFGAYVTLLCLQQLRQLPLKVKLVVQTPSVRMDRTLLAMIQMSEQTFRASDRFTVPRQRPLEIRYSFYLELRQNVALDSYDMPILILQGEEDSYISMEDIQNFRRINEQARLVIIPGASHRFLEPGAWDMVLDLTRDWFEYEQVLLSEWE